MWRNSLTPVRSALLGLTMLLLCGLAVHILAGCAPSMPRTYPVQGQVTVKGGKLAPKSTIIFQLASDPNVTADGEIQPDGTFTLATRLFGQSQDGAVEGDHNVLIHEGSVGDGPQAFRPLMVAKKSK